MTIGFPVLLVLILVALFEVVRRSQCDLSSTPISHGSPAPNGAAALLAAVVVTATVFLGAFFLLGFIELATGLHIVRSSYAAGIVLIIFILTTLWLRRNHVKVAVEQSDVRSDKQSAATRIWAFVKTGPAAQAATLYLLALILLLLLLVPSFPRGFEAGAKHLPIGLHFLHNHTLLMWDTVQSHNYPANGAIYFGFLLSFLPERAVTLSNVPILIPMSVAIYSLARLAGADSKASLWAALGLLTVPLISFNIFELEVDLAGVAFLAMSVYFIVAKPQTRPSWPILAGLSIGIAYGIKAVHLISAVYLGLVLLLALIPDRRNTVTLTRRLQPVFAFSIAALAIASYWLVRNYLLLQNPLYPVHLPFFDLLGWTGKSPANVSTSDFQLEWVRSSGEWLAYPWLEWHFLDQNFKATSGLGAFFATVVPASFFAAALYLLSTLRKPVSYDADHAFQALRALRVLVGGALFVLTVWYVMGARQPRYAIAALVYLLPLAGWAVAQTSNIRRNILDYLLLICALFMLFVFSFSTAIDAASRFLISRQFSRAAFYEYPNMLDTLPAGSTVMNLGGRSWNYSMFGDGHKNVVVSYRKTVQTFGRYRVEVGPDRRFSESNYNADYFLLATQDLLGFGATHIFALGEREFLSDGCTTLREMQRLDRNPSNNIALPDPRILFKIEYCADARQASRD